MQLVENSIIGLRSARHVFKQRDSNIRVTLFPMIHIGEKEFFEAVYQDAFAHDAVLVEGLKSPITNRITRSYRWMAGSKLGLVIQPKYPKPESVKARIVHADLSHEEFLVEWQKMPLKLRLLIYFLAPMVGLWGR